MTSKSRIGNVYRFMDSVFKLKDDHLLYPDGYTFHFAIDFDLIFEYVFPILNIQNDTTRAFENSEVIGTLFDKDWFSEEPLLLRPYLIEFTHYWLSRTWKELLGSPRENPINVLQKNLSEQDRKNLKEIIQLSKNESETSPNKELVSEFTKLLFNNSRSFVAFFSETFKDSLSKTRFLLSSEPGALHRPSDLWPDLSQLLNERYNDDFSQSKWYEALKLTRNKPGSDYLDAMAIEIVSFLNEQLIAKHQEFEKQGKTKPIVLLLTGTKHISRLSQLATGSSAERYAEAVENSLNKLLESDTFPNSSVTLKGNEFSFIRSKDILRTYLFFKDGKRDNNEIVNVLKSFIKQAAALGVTDGFLKEASIKCQEHQKSDKTGNKVICEECDKKENCKVFKTLDNFANEFSNIIDTLGIVKLVNLQSSKWQNMEKHIKKHNSEFEKEILNLLRMVSLKDNDEFSASLINLEKKTNKDLAKLHKDLTRNFIKSLSLPVPELTYRLEKLEKLDYHLMPKGHVYQEFFKILDNGNKPLQKKEKINLNNNFRTYIEKMFNLLEKNNDPEVNFLFAILLYCFQNYSLALNYARFCQEMFRQSGRSTQLLNDSLYLEIVIREEQGLIQKNARLIKNAIKLARILYEKEKTPRHCHLLGRTMGQLIEVTQSESQHFTLPNVINIFFEGLHKLDKISPLGSSDKNLRNKLINNVVYAYTLSLELNEPNFKIIQQKELMERVGALRKIVSDSRWKTPSFLHTLGTYYSQKVNSESNRQEKDKFKNIAMDYLQEAKQLCETKKGICVASIYEKINQSIKKLQE